MPKWIENAKRIYKSAFEGTEDAVSFLSAIRDSCDEKGYNEKETDKVISYIAGE